MGEVLDLPPPEKSLKGLLWQERARALYERYAHVLRALYELAHVLVIHILVQYYAPPGESWAELVAGTVIGFTWISMAGNSPVAWLFFLGTLQVTDARWAAFTDAIVERYGDVYDGYGGWAMGHLGFGVFAVTYIGHGLLLLPFDLMALQQQSKIQPGKYHVTDPKRPLGRLLRALVVNFVLTYFFNLAMTAQVVWTRGRRGYDFGFGKPLPSKQQQVAWFILGLCWNEVNFYYSHRLLHHPRLYAKIHKKHHEYTAPFGLMALYSHPVEHLISNLWAFLGVMPLLRFHGYFAYCWVAAAIMGTQTHHCGYRFPWIAEFDHQPDFHDLHHQLFNCNFGNTTWLDKLHGTAKDPWETREKIKKLEEDKYK
jgi:methylsterol monooxygenase